MKPKGSEENVHKWVWATVTDILPNQINILVGQKNKPKVGIEYKIEFILNRLSFQMEQRALEIMQRFNLIKVLFPEPVPELNDYDTQSHIQE